MKNVLVYSIPNDGLEWPIPLRTLGEMLLRMRNTAGYGMLETESKTIPVLRELGLRIHVILPSNPNNAPIATEFTH